jgi:hypothetical protein
VTGGCVLGAAVCAPSHTMLPAAQAQIDGLRFHSASPNVVPQTIRTKVRSRTIGNAHHSADLAQAVRWEGALGIPSHSEVRGP